MPVGGVSQCHSELGSLQVGSTLPEHDIEVDWGGHSVVRGVGLRRRIPIAAGDERTLSSGCVDVTTTALLLMKGEPTAMWGVKVRSKQYKFLPVFGVPMTTPLIPFERRPRNRLRF